MAAEFQKHVLRRDPAAKTPRARPPRELGTLDRIGHREGLENQVAQSVPRQRIETEPGVLWIQPSENRRRPGAWPPNAMPRRPSRSRGGGPIRRPRRPGWRCRGSATAVAPLEGSPEPARPTAAAPPVGNDPRTIASCGSRPAKPAAWIIAASGSPQAVTPEASKSAWSDSSRKGIRLLMKANARSRAGAKFAAPRCCRIARMHTCRTRSRLDGVRSAEFLERRRRPTFPAVIGRDDLPIAGVVGRSEDLQ